MKFSGEVGNGQVNKCLNFGGDPESGSGIRIQIRIRICDPTLVRRALAEVCTVQVLLVCYLHLTLFLFTYLHSHSPSFMVLSIL